MSVKSKEGYWYNYKAGAYDYRAAPKTDEEAVCYLPQGAGVCLFSLLREHEGYTVPEAMLHVLEIAVGEKDTNGYPAPGDGDKEATQ